MHLSHVIGAKHDPKSPPPRHPELLSPRHRILRIQGQRIALLVIVHVITTVLLNTFIDIITEHLCLTVRMTVYAYGLCNRVSNINTLVLSLMM